MSGGGGAGPGAARPAAARAALALAVVGVLATLVALGTWQLQRRTWKLELIARVERRVHAAPVAPPPARDWPGLTAQDDEYRRVRVAGTFLRDRDTLVHAATTLGSGYWVLTPLATADGTIVLVNRGFVPPGWRDRGADAPGAPQGAVTVTGLLRLSEPGGAFLRPNDPAAGRWTSRDVAAIAAARGLSGVAPYFIDAEAPPQSDSGSGADAGNPQQPVAGLTLIVFPNNHLVYAITWYALALMVAVRAGYVALSERRRRRD